MTRFLLGSLIGLCIGALTHALTWPAPTPSPPGVPFEPARWVRSDCPPPSPPEPTDPDEAIDAEQLVRTLHAVAATREALRLAIGEPVPFDTILEADPQ